ncbi:MAG: site-specific integrase [Clostridia bacterium]|nr:site-specific integrase [Clostridia bacterium]
MNNSNANFTSPTHRDNIEQLYLTHVNCGKLSADEAREIYEQAMKEAVLSKYTFPAKQSSDGYYHIQVSDPTKSTGRRQIKAKTISELKNKVLDYENGLNGHIRKTFRSGFEIAMSEKLKYVKNPDKLVSVKNSIAVTKCAYRRYFEGSEFENKYIDEISKRDIEDVCFQILQRLNMGKKAFAEMQGILRVVFRLAYEEYWITDNPFSRVNFKKYKDLLTPTVPITERYHSDEEIRNMLDYIHAYQVKKPNHVPAYALELQMLMGLRRGEVAPLEWTDIHEDRYIKITKEQITEKKSDSNNKDRFVIVEHTKTYVDRQFPITQDIRDFLDRYKQVHKEYYPDSKYLFPSQTTENGVINNYAVYHFYSRMCKKLGIRLSREKVRGPHSFRRNGITKVTNNSGGDLILASQLFGNSPETAKKNYYVGLDIEKAKKALEG